MKTLQRIKNAVDTTDLENIVNESAKSLGIELDTGSTYAELAERFEDKSAEADNIDAEIMFDDIAEILRAAESKWFELEDAASVHITPAN